MIRTIPDFIHAAWRKSTHSGDNAGQCVELAFLGTAVGLRDSKDKATAPSSSSPPASGPRSSLRRGTESSASGSGGVLMRQGDY
ncbi:MAG: DUF397 domain-containing protein [Pseudonocardiales bacterium]|nr:DUF397 domain-containing protein [Pseudonocardiales bacterium]MBV9028748.1 DUF397 domain-containing protein [Pseudonocardiales bacterium]